MKGDGMEIVDLFCGAGGWAGGLDLLGVDPRDTLGIDNAPDPVATHVAAGFPAVVGDVAAYMEGAHLAPGMFDGLIASPPCQAFSRAGKGHGRKAIDALLDHVASCMDGWRPPQGVLVADDVRADLTLEPLRWALALNPRWVTLEQVPEVLPAWEAIGEVLAKRGYSVWTGRLQAEEYGVPQTRRRAFLVASREHEVDRPPSTHTRYYAQREGGGRHDVPGQPESKGGGRAEEAGLLPWVSMADALGWGLPDRPANTWPVGSAHGTSGIEWGGASVREEIRRREAAGDPKEWVSKLDRREQWGTSAAEDWPAHRPATTVAGRDLIADPGTNANRFNDSTKSRNEGIRVSVQDAALLQSFPSDWPWQGTQSSQYRQVGNAVPPLLAAHVLREAMGGA